MVLFLYNGHLQCNSSVLVCIVCRIVTHMRSLWKFIIEKPSSGLPSNKGLIWVSMPKIVRDVPERKRAEKSIAACMPRPSWLSNGANSRYPSCCWLAKGYSFRGFPILLLSNQACVLVFSSCRVWWPPARIGVCLICRAKLVHKKKDFGRGHVYRIIAGDWLLNWRLL